jgi:hypothetical protein
MDVLPVMVKTIGNEHSIALRFSTISDCKIADDSQSNAANNNVRDFGTRGPYYMSEASNEQGNE